MPLEYGIPRKICAIKTADSRKISPRRKCKEKLNIFTIIFKRSFDEILLRSNAISCIKVDKIVLKKIIKT